MNIWIITSLFLVGLGSTNAHASCSKISLWDVHLFQSFEGISPDGGKCKWLRIGTPDTKIVISVDVEDHCNRDGACFPRRLVEFSMAEDNYITDCSSNYRGWSINLGENSYRGYSINRGYGVTISDGQNTATCIRD